MNNDDSNSSIARMLGSNIKQIRTLEGLSQEQLAERISKSSHFVSLLERGQSLLSVPTLIDICRALNTDTNSVFAGIIDASKVCTNSFLNKSFETFDSRDRDMVSYLVNYIISSKS